MKIRKKLRMLAAGLLLLAFGLLAPCLRAQADEVWEPYEVAFYYAHSEDCTIVEEIWETNAAGGIRMLFEPDSDEVIYEFDSIGVKMMIYVIYENPAGGNWGYTEYYKDGQWYSGWIPMALLWKTYSTEMFERQYKDKISSAEAKIDASDGEISIHVFSYPGGPENSSITLPEGEVLTTFKSYTDAEGRKWGYVDYFYGHHDWICLDDPGLTFDELWPNGAPEADQRTRTYYEISYSKDSTEVREIDDPSENTSAAESRDPSGGNAAESSTPIESSPEPNYGRKGLSGFRFWIIPAAVGGIVVLSAAVLLILLLKKRRSGTGSDD